MDEDDFAENGIAPRRVAATTEFDEDGSRKRQQPSAPDGIFAGARLDELVVQTDNSVGKKLVHQGANTLTHC